MDIPWNPKGGMPMTMIASGQSIVHACIDSQGEKEQKIKMYELSYSEDLPKYIISIFMQ